MPPPGPRPWFETVTGYAWTGDDSSTFEEAINAFIGRIIMEGGAIVLPVPYVAFMGPDGNVAHTAMVTYYAPHRVSYRQALEDYFDAIDDGRAAVDFVREDSPEDSHEVLARWAEEEEDE